MFRGAAGLGADAVLVGPRCADPLYRRSVRVSMGTVFQVPWTRLAEWPQAGDELRAEGFHLAALTRRRSTTSPWIRPSASPSCSVPRVTGSAAKRSLPPTRS